MEKLAGYDFAYYIITTWLSLKWWSFLLLVLSLASTISGILSPGTSRRGGMSAFIVMNMFLKSYNILKPLLFLNSTAVQ